MVEQYNPKIVTITNGRETHLISARFQEHATSEELDCYSTRVRNIDHDSMKDSREKRGMRISYRDSDLMRYVLNDDANISGKSPSNTDMIDLVEGDEDDIWITGLEPQKEFLPIKVPLMSGMAVKEGQRRIVNGEKNGEKFRISEQGLLSDALSRCQHFMAYLKDDYGDGREVRIVHTLYERRELGMMSARISNDEEAETCVVGVLWQTMNRPQKAVCINFSRSESQQISVICTCDVLPTATSGYKSQCLHVHACQRDNGLIARVEHVLRASNQYFGPHLKSYADVFPAAELQRQDRRRVTARTLKWMQEWSFWVVFDADRRIFAPVLRISAKPFQCLLCRTSTHKRGLCGHEASCVVANKNSETDALVHGAEELPTEDDPVAAEVDPILSTATQWEKYMGNRHPRSLLLCPGEINSTMVIDRLLEETEPGYVLRLTDFGLATCPRCGKQQGRYFRSKYRTVRLFTLSHGAPLIRVLDWECADCRKQVYFSGQWVGIFPARRDSAFTVELLNVYLQNVCYQGQSMRHSYFATRVYSTAVSTMQRFRQTERAGNVSGEKKRTRRRANEALRAFLRNVDVHSDEVTKKLFSCEDCEVPLSESDRLELGLSEVDTGGMRRFKAVVIDGTAAGILGNLPKFDSETQMIPAHWKIRRHQRMVKGLENRKAIKQMCNLARTNVRNILQGRKKRVRADKVEFSLNLPSRWKSKTGGKKAKAKFMTDGHIDIMRIYLDSDTCFCGRSWLRDANHSEVCLSKRRRFEKSGDSSQVVDLLKACFDVTKSEEEEESSDEDQPLEPDTLPDREEEDGTVTNETTVGPGPVRSVWMGILRIVVWKNGGQLSESLLDLVEFLLTEHAGLVYILPFRPTQADDVDLCAQRFIQPGVLRRSCASLAAPSLQMHGRLTSKLKSFANCRHSASEAWPCASCRQRIAAEIIEVCNVNPVLTRFCQELLNSSEKIPRQSRVIASAVADCLVVHIATASNYFEEFDSFSSDEAAEYWDKYASVVMEMSQSGELGQDQTSADHGDEDRDEEGDETVMQRGEQGEENEEEEGEDSEEGEEKDEAGVTGICFPGRTRCRPGIVFEGNETHQCTKQYPESRLYSPGLLTVQCACENPKLIGFIVMKKVESTALTLSAVLSHFAVPPRVVYYDNACNMFASTMLRTPWLLHMSRVVVDRFHYKSHKCSSFFDPDSYKALDNQRTTTAESFNARIDKAIHHMRYLRGENLVPYLRVRFAFLNLAAHYQKRYQISDMEDADLTTFLSEFVACNCPPCQWLNADKENRTGLLPHEVPEDNGGSGDVSIICEVQAEPSNSEPNNEVNNTDEEEDGEETNEEETDEENDEETDEETDEEEEKDEEEEG